LRRMMHLNRLVMHKVLAEKGKHHGEHFALVRLAVRDGISQRELAEVLHLSAPRVSSILDSLEKGGCVLRRPDESDRRLTRVFITETGLRRQKEHLATVGEYVNRTIGALSEEDRGELERLLNTLADRVSEVLEQESGDPRQTGIEG